MPRLRRVQTPWGVAGLAVLAMTVAGCGGSSAAEVTSTVLATETSVAVTTSTVVQTTVSVAVQTTTSVETSTSIAVSTAAAPSPDTPGPAGGPPCPADPAYFDESLDGLAPALIAGWRVAKSDAAAAGVTMCVNDGKRSKAQQEETFASYVAQYGQDAARTYVLTPEKSAHVAGYAVDVQPASAYSWLEATDGRYGFCRMYDNEAWHFEYAETFRLGCPPRRAQPVS